MSMPRMSVSEAIRLGVDLRAALGCERPSLPPTLHITAATLISFGGNTLTVGQWSRHLSIDLDTLKDRLRLGWDVKRALMEPALGSAARAQRTRNLRVIRRITEAFDAAPATGGYQGTSATSPGTGVGSIAHHLHQQEISE